MRAALPIAVVVAVLVAALVWRDGESLKPGAENAKAAKADAMANRQGGVSAMARPSVVPPPRAVTTAAIMPVPPRATLSADMRQLRDRRSYKELYERLSALPEPTAEQKYILAEIHSQCGVQQQRQQAAMAKKAAPDPAQVRAEFAATISPKDPNRDARLEAYDRAMSRPCDGVQIATPNYKALMEAAAAGGDAKARLRLLSQEIFNPPGQRPGDASNRSISDAQLVALKQLAVNDDPVAVAGAFNMMGMSMANFSLRVGPQEQPLDDGAYRVAVELLGCELGLDCGRDSFMLAYSCAAQNQCGAMDVREFHMSYRLAPGSAGLVDEYLQALRRARAGDWSYFTVVAGPTPQGALYGRR